MQVSIHVCTCTCISKSSFLGGGLSETLYSQIWSKFKFEHSCAMLVAVGKLPSFSASVLMRYTECWCCLLVVCCCLLVVCYCLLVRSYSERAQKSSYESYAPGYVPSLNSFRRQHGTRTTPQPSRQFNIEREVTIFCDVIGTLL